MQICEQEFPPILLNADNLGMPNTSFHPKHHLFRLSELILLHQVVQQRIQNVEAPEVEIFAVGCIDLHMGPTYALK